MGWDGPPHGVRRNGSSGEVWWSVTARRLPRPVAGLLVVRRARWCRAREAAVERWSWAVVQVCVVRGRVAGDGCVTSGSRVARRREAPHWSRSDRGVLPLAAGARRAIWTERIGHGPGVVEPALRLTHGPGGQRRAQVGDGSQSGQHVVRSNGRRELPYDHLQYGTTCLNGHRRADHGLPRVDVLGAVLGPLRDPQHRLLPEEGLDGGGQLPGVDPGQVDPPAGGVQPVGERAAALDGLDAPPGRRCPAGSEASSAARTCVRVTALGQPDLEVLRLSDAAPVGAAPM